MRRRRDADNAEEEEAQRQTRKNCHAYCDPDQLPGVVLLVPKTGHDAAGVFVATACLERGDPLRLLDLELGQVLSLRRRYGSGGTRHRRWQSALPDAAIHRIEMDPKGRRATLELWPLS